MSKNISLVQLRYAITLEKYGHFGVAAKKCHITQPTLSMQIQKMEEELGLMLFDRSKQPIIPTDLGLKVLNQARKVIAEFEEMDEILASEKNEIAGDYRLGVIPTVAPYLLPLFLSRFSKKHPRINLIIQEAVTERIIDQLNHDQLDCGIIATPYPAEGLQETVLYYEPFWAYISPSHPLFQSREVKRVPSDLSDLWILEEGHCFGAQALNLCQRRTQLKNAKTTFNARFQSGNLETLKALVDQDMGMTLLPDLAVRKSLSYRDRLKLRPFSSPVPVREVSCVRTRLFSKKRLFDALVDSIQKSLPKDLPKKDNATNPVVVVPI